LHGNVDFPELTLSFRVPGRLERLTLEEGDRVVAGQVMAVLDQRPFLDELAVRRAQSREIEAALVNAEKKLRRLDALLVRRSASQSDYDDALAARDELAARLETAKALLAQAGTALEDATLTSPSAGVVLTRAREPGSVAGAGDPVYVVSLDRPVWARAYVEEPDLGRVTLGRRVVVLTDSGGRFAGQVGFVSPRAEFTPKTVETRSARASLVYRLRIVVDEPGPGLLRGMPVTVVFEEPPR
jgi:HlyD family secretion protein